jgi:polysaccharide pyruvyl transferase WcaK-like protein
MALAGADLQVGLSPIAYGHPGLWPTEDRPRYEHYINQLASFVTGLLKRGISVTLFSSASPDDQIFRDLRARIDPGLQSDARRRLSSCSLSSIHDLLRLLYHVDIVVSSRLHGLILSFLAKKPAVALSYDRKVEALMADLGQEAYCLDIRSFDEEGLLTAFQSLQLNSSLMASKLNSICREYDQLFQWQYRLVTQLLARGVRSSRQARTLVASETGLYRGSADVRPLT